MREIHVYSCEGFIFKCMMKVHCNARRMRGACAVKGMAKQINFCFFKDFKTRITADHNHHNTNSYSTLNLEFDLKFMYDKSDDTKKHA